MEIVVGNVVLHNGLKSSMCSAGLRFADCNGLSILFTSFSYSPNHSVTPGEQKHLQLWFCMQHLFLHSFTQVYPLIFSPYVFCHMHTQGWKLRNYCQYFFKCMTQMTTLNMYNLNRKLHCKYKHLYCTITTSIIVLNEVHISVGYEWMNLASGLKASVCWY